MARFRTGSGDPGADTLTLVIVPGNSGQIRRLQLRRAWLRRGLYAGAALAVLGAALSVDYVRARQRLGELDGLRRLTAQQQEELRGYSERLTALSKGLGQVAQLERKLRVITNLDPADAVPLPGIGGVDDELLGEPDLLGMSREQQRERLTRVFERLTQATQAQSSSLTDLVAHLESQTALLSATPSIAPTRGWVTSRFGYRTSPFTGSRELHRGVDIAGRSGTAVVAPADGVVRFAGAQRALGNAVALRHGYGVETLFGHLQEILVRSGEHVKRGQKIALLGNTGRSTGPHLHYQVEVNGAPVNPQNYILD
jgi:murein DD-endopeptidase MepM/ murein hydrolase activator NlpD